MSMLVIFLGLILALFLFQILRSVTAGAWAFVILYKENESLIQREDYLWKQCQDQDFVNHVPDTAKFCPLVLHRRQLGAFHYTVSQYNVQGMTWIHRLLHWNVWLACLVFLVSIGLVWKYFQQITKKTNTTSIF